jgi:hypothetical protein
MQIDVTKLRDMIVSVLDHMSNDLNIKTVAIGERDNFYWEVAADQMWTFETTTPQLEVGSLSDDCEFTMLAADDLLESGQVPDRYTLIHAAPLLRFIAEGAWITNPANPSSVRPEVKP